MVLLPFPPADIPCRFFHLQLNGGCNNSACRFSHQPLSEEGMRKLHEEEERLRAIQRGEALPQRQPEHTPTQPEKGETPTGSVQPAVVGVGGVHDGAPPHQGQDSQEGVGGGGWWAPHEEYWGVSGASAVDRAMAEARAANVVVQAPTASQVPPPSTVEPSESHPDVEAPTTGLLANPLQQQTSLSSW